jgi:hypothetical protein
MLLFLCISALCAEVTAQTDRAWAQMSIASAEKLLRSSAWAQTQSETDTSEMFYTPTRAGTSSIGAVSANRGGANAISDQQNRNNSRADRGALNQAISVNYQVRLFSSRPIREALSRIVLAKLTEPGPAVLEQWQGFIERDFGPFVVVTVSYDSADGRLLGPSIQAFAAATAETLRNTAYLERDDGKRLYLLHYRPPGADGLGAKFVFQRLLDGEPFLKTPKGSLRFAADMGGGIRLNVKFKVSSMVLDGKIEY